MKRLLSVALFMASATFALAQTSYFITDGVAIRGYDPVAYFTESTPVKGKKEFSYPWQGAEWQFSSKANLDAFKGTPEKYAPQFGGYCAYGVSENHKSPTEPAAFTIVDDKLYLNYSLKVKELWIKDTKGRIQTAEEFWPALKDKKD